MTKKTTTNLQVAAASLIAKRKLLKKKKCKKIFNIHQIKAKQNFASLKQEINLQSFIVVESYSIHQLQHG